MISSIANLVYELPHELPNKGGPLCPHKKKKKDLRILGNKEILAGFTLSLQKHDVYIKVLGVTLCNQCENGKKIYVCIKNTKYLCSHFLYINWVFVIIHNMLPSTWKQRQDKARRFFIKQANNHTKKKKEGEQEE